MKRLICWLLGHKDTVSVWEPWGYDPEVGRFRVLRDECPRCGSVVGLRSQVEDQPWTP